MNFTDLIVSALKNEQNPYSFLPLATDNKEMDDIPSETVWYGCVGDIETTLRLVRRAIEDYPRLFQEHLNAQMKDAMSKSDEWAQTARESPVWGLVCPCDADIYTVRSYAILCGEIGAFFVEEQQIFLIPNWKTLQFTRK